MKSELTYIAFFLAGCFVLAAKLDVLTYIGIGLLFISQAIAIDQLRNELEKKSPSTI